MSCPKWQAFGQSIYEKRTAIRAEKQTQQAVCDTIEQTYGVKMSVHTLGAVEAGHETSVRNYLALCLWLNVHPHIYAGIDAPLPDNKSAQFCADSPQGEPK